MQQHQSTDLICFYIFTIIQIISLIIGLYSFYQGDVVRIGLPSDADHNICGFDYGYIYFTTPYENYLYRTVCVSECPKAQQNVEQLLCQTNSIVKSCKVDPSVLNISQSVLAYATLPYKNKICLPQNIEYYNQVKGLIVPQSYQEIGFEFQASVWGILGCVLPSILLSLLIILFIERQGSFIIACMQGITMVCLLGILIQEVLIYSNTNSKLQEVIQLIEYTDNLWVPLNLHVTIIVSVSIMIVVAGIFIFNLNKKRALLALFLKVGGDFIKANKNILFIPILGSLVMGFYVMLETQIFIRLLSITTFHQKDFSPFSQILEPFNLFIICINVAISLWTISIIGNFCESLISGKVLEWHNQNYRKNTPSKNIFKDLITYHIGSIALGAILVPIVSIFEMLSFLCQNFYIQRLLGISKQCYTLMYIESKHFFECSFEITDLYSKNSDIYSKIGKLGQKFIMISSLSISGLCGILSVFVFKDQTYAIVLTVFIFFFSYLQTAIFISIYGQSSESVFILYLYYLKHNPDFEDQTQCTNSLKNVLLHLENQEQLEGPQN